MHCSVPRGPKFHSCSMGAGFSVPLNSGPRPFLQDAPGPCQHAASCLCSCSAWDRFSGPHLNSGPSRFNGTPQGSSQRAALSLGALNFGLAAHGRNSRSPRIALQARFWDTPGPPPGHCSVPGGVQFWSGSMRGAGLW